MISAFFINRPIFANVIAIITIILGAVCLFRLPVTQYPNIVPPTIQVTTSYPGASAQVVANTVGIPLEQAVNGVKNSIYISLLKSISRNKAQTCVAGFFRKNFGRFNELAPIFWYAKT